jgi:hypothetical protein
LKRTRKCLAIDRKVRSAKRELSRLKEEKASIRDSRSGGNRRSQLIAELARNGCGDQYRYEARRNSSNSWFGDGGFNEIFGGDYYRPRRRDNPGDNTIQPYATYRTMCVRLCDGFYFPVSFSTLPSNFSEDQNRCQSECAAPAELYVYRNPGGEVEQMIAPDGRPYDALQNAWRFRKEYIKGCSCKASEYSEAEILGHDNKDTMGPPPPQSPKRQGAVVPPPTKAKRPAIARKAAKPPATIEDLIR